MGPRYLAPAGAPFRTRDLARWVMLAASSPDQGQTLRDAICARFGVRRTFLTSTGRAGMTLLLKSMRRLAPARRDEVVLPAYTCYSVAASAMRAGLRPRVVDISPETLDYAPEALADTDFSRVLAVVATNLYGLPNDLPALSLLTKSHGVFLIDDAAQAMGASVEARPSGTWGDAGLFSFDKGKNVSAIDGGVIVTNSDDVEAVLRQEVSKLPAQPAATSVVHMMKALAYFAMLRPSLYGVPARLPQLGLGKTVFTLDYPISGPDPALVTLALAMLPRLETFTQARVHNASALLEELRSIPGVRGIAPGTATSPVYLRLPVLFATPASRNATMNALIAAGIGASGSYPAALVDVPEIHACLANAGAPAHGGRYVAERIMTLPTHPFVTAKDVLTMAAIVRRGGDTATEAGAAAHRDGAAEV